VLRILIADLIYWNGCRFGAQEHIDALLVVPQSPWFAGMRRFRKWQEFRFEKVFECWCRLLFAEADFAFR
jgi:hypothetical protein